MIISNGQVNDILRMYDMRINKVSGSTVEVVKAGKRPGNDQLALSETSKMRSVAFNALIQVADVRPEKVEPIVQQIATGTYTVSEGEVADKIINRLLVDEFI